MEVSQIPHHVHYIFGHIKDIRHVSEHCGRLPNGIFYSLYRPQNCTTNTWHIQAHCGRVPNHTSRSLHSHNPQTFQTTLEVSQITHPVLYIGHIYTILSSEEAFHIILPAVHVDESSHSQSSLYRVRQHFNIKSLITVLIL